jgi:hypothetical protein
MAVRRPRLRLVQGRQRYRPPKRLPRMLPSHATVDRRGFVIAIAIIGVIFGGLYLFADGDPNCRIKGNVSVSGERIYHRPSDDYYMRTVVNPFRGERWFCSEADARQAGWRPARV